MVGLPCLLIVDSLALHVLQLCVLDTEVDIAGGTLDQGGHDHLHVGLEVVLQSLADASTCCIG